MEIWDDATLNINAGGLLKVEDQSEIIVKTGGRLYINNLAALEMLGDSKLVVERGGELIVQNGANLKLEKAITDDELGSKIQIFGKLIADGGLLDVSQGLGYIVLEEGATFLNTNTLTMNWVGHGKEETAFIVRIPISTNLNTTFDNANIQMERNINVKPASLPKEVLVNNSILHPAFLYNKPEPIKLECKEGGNIIIKDSEFFRIMFDADNFSQISMENTISTSRDLQANMKISNTGFLSLKNTEVYNEFIPALILPDGSIYERIGLDLNHVKYSILESTNIEHKITIGDNPETSGIINRNDNISPKVISKAIRIENSSVLFMKNTLIKQAGFGVYSSGAVSVIMDQSTIRDCFKEGIEMTGTNDAGLVRMTCSNLIYNAVGIAGIDITLDIDAFVLSQTLDGNVRSNTFKTEKNLQYFQICYQKKQPDPIVYARGNIWNYPISAYFQLEQSGDEERVILNMIWKLSLILFSILFMYHHVQNIRKKIVFHLLYQIFLWHQMFG
ncbi:MAG: hypothetical protein R2771_02650 [Saprospiraceae bacterium]